MASIKSLAVATFIGLMSTVGVVQADEPWQFHVTPYLWGAGMQGTVGLAGRDTSVDAGFHDLVEFVDKGGAIRFSARRGRWGGFVDYFGVTLKNQQQVAAGTIDTKAKQSITELGLSYQINSSLEILAGARRQSLDNEISFPAVGKISDSQTWTDGFGGARWTPVDTDKWVLWVRGDAGAGGSNFTWLATAGAGYRFNDTFSILVAYRYLKTDYRNGGFKWDVAQKGIGVGFDVAW